MWKPCGNTMLNTRFRCRFGDVYSCFRCCGHSGTVPHFYMFPSGFSWRKTNKCIRKYNFMLTCAETHSNVAETWIFYNSVDVIIPKRSRKYKVTFRKHVFLLFRRRNQTERRRKYWVTFRKQIFVLFLLTNSDLEWTETLDFVPETLFFLFPLFIGLFQHSLFVIFLFHYRTGKYVLIVRFYITSTRLLYRPFVKSMLRTM